MFRSLIVFLVATLFLVPLYSDQTIDTGNGKTLFIRDNGTWEIYDADDSDQKPTIFRKTRWGMDPVEVKWSETSYFRGEIPYENNIDLMYSGEIGEYDVIIRYGFIDSKLVSGLYTFESSLETTARRKTEFNAIKKLLIDKYGQPTTDNSAGTEMLMAQWKKDDTEITLIIYNKPRQKLRILYKSDLYYSLMQNEKTTTSDTLMDNL